MLCLLPLWFCSRIDGSTRRYLHCYSYDLLRRMTALPSLWGQIVELWFWLRCLPFGSTVVDRFIASYLSFLPLLFLNGAFIHAPFISIEIWDFLGHLFACWIGGWLLNKVDMILSDIGSVASTLGTDCGHRFVLIDGLLEVAPWWKHGNLARGFDRLDPTSTPPITLY